MGSSRDMILQQLINQQSGQQPGPPITQQEVQQMRQMMAPSQGDEQSAIGHGLQEMFAGLANPQYKSALSAMAQSAPGAVAAYAKERGRVNQLNSEALKMIEKRRENDADRRQRDRETYLKHTEEDRMSPYQREMIGLKKQELESVKHSPDAIQEFPDGTALDLSKINTKHIVKFKPGSKVSNDLGLKETVLSGSIHRLTEAQNLYKEYMDLKSQNALNPENPAYGKLVRGYNDFMGYGLGNKKLTNLADRRVFLNSMIGRLRLAHEADIESGGGGNKRMLQGMTQYMEKKNFFANPDKMSDSQVMESLNQVFEPFQASTLAAVIPACFVATAPVVRLNQQTPLAIVLFLKKQKS